MAISQNGLAYQYASHHLKDREDFILEAVKQNWKVLEHAHKWTSNYEII